MRGVLGECGGSENLLIFFSQVFLVFYLTPLIIFVNRLGLPAKLQTQRAASESARRTPQ